MEQKRELTKKGAIRRDQRRKEIVEIAMVLFARHGLEGVALRQIAEAVGIPIGTLFYYFPEKEMLYEAAVSTAIVNLSEYISVVSTEQGTAEERLEKFVRSMFKLFSDMTPSMILGERQLLELAANGVESSMMPIEARDAIEASQAHMREVLGELMSLPADDDRVEWARDSAVSLAYGIVRLRPWYSQTRRDKSYHEEENIVRRILSAVKAICASVLPEKADNAPDAPEAKRVSRARSDARTPRQIRAPRRRRSDEA